MIRASTMHWLRTTIALSLLGPAATACGDDLPDDTTTGVIVAESTTGSSSSTSSSTSSGALSSSEGGSSTTGHTTVGIPDECALSEDCPRGELCVAPFDQSAGPEGKGPLACVTECVVIMDEDRWCADAAACCDLDAECTDRGYCVFPSETETGTEAGTETGSGSETGATGSTGSTGG